MRSPLVVLVTDLTRLAVSARAAARRIRTRPGSRRRARWAALMSTMLALTLGGAARALAADGKVPNPFLDPFAIKDTHGFTTAQYALSTGGGGFGLQSMIDGTAGFFLSLGWDAYRMIVSIILWLYDFALQFKILEILTGPANVIAVTLGDTIGRFHVVEIFLLLAFIMCLGWFLKGKASAGLVEIFISLVAATLIGSVLANPVERISGPNGMIMQAHDMGVALSAQVISGGRATSSDPAALQQQTSAKLAEQFIRIPHQLINYGAVIDTDPACVGVYNDIIGSGPYGTDSHPRDAMGDCNKAYKDAAENPMQGLLGMVLVTFGGALLMLLVLALVIVLTLLVVTALWQGAKFAYSLLKGILPGTSRQAIFEALGVLLICYLAIIAAIAGVGGFTVALDSLFSHRDWNPLVTFVVVDLFIVVALIALIRFWISTRKAGKKMGERLQKAITPSPAAVATHNRPSPLRMVTSMATQQMATKRALARSPLAAGAGAGAGSPGLSQNTPATLGDSGAASRPSVAKMAAAGTWKAGKVALASTVGAPVYAPRAAAAVKTAATAKKAAMAAKIAAARDGATQQVQDKLDQAGAFGREYVHNVGAAARTVSRVSGATHVAKMAMSVGADPLTAGAIAGATYAAGTIKARSNRAESSQIAPQHHASPPAKPTPARSTPSPATVPTLTVTPAMAAAARHEEARQKLLRDIKARHAARATAGLVSARPGLQDRRSA